MSQLEAVNPFGMGLSVADKSVSELFPEIDHQFRPYRWLVLVQMRRVINKTASGIVLPREVKETEAYNSQVAKIVAIGPLAFRNRETLHPWGGEMCCRVGDYVKVPRWGGERAAIDLNDGLDAVISVVFEDKNILGKYEGDVRDVRSHLM